MMIDKIDSILLIENLRVQYGGAHALSGIDLGVAQGETVALVGAKGAEKPSVLKDIMGLVAVKGGRFSWMAMRYFILK